MSSTSAMASHEVLDLVSEAEDENPQDCQPSSSLLRPPRFPPHHAMSDSEDASVTVTPRKRLKLSASPSSSPARSVPSATEDDDSASVITVSSRDTRGTDNDEDDVIDFSDLDTDVNTTSILHTSIPITLSTASAAEADTAAVASTLTSHNSKKRKQTVMRYFGGEDLSLKCFNCGAAGHRSEECPAEKACYICGQSLATHTKKRGCLNEPCWRCGGIGHQKSVRTAHRTLQGQCDVDDIKFEI